MNNPAKVKGRWHLTAHTRPGSRKNEARLKLLGRTVGDRPHQLVLPASAAGLRAAANDSTLCVATGAGCMVGVSLDFGASTL